MPNGRAGDSMEQNQRRAPKIPDHEVLGFIGRGAYGEIWLARSLTGSLRAVKVIPRKRFEDDMAFDREFAGMARFEPVSRSHRGFVDILHVGRNDRRGFFYYVMELADDRSAGRPIDTARYVPRTLRADMEGGKPLPAGTCLEVALGLIEALEFLHGSGLVHRDVKPANVIFVDGRPKLADIGLVASAGQLSFVGTEGYVPPDGPGTVAADLYGLGKVIYEMSTGKDRMDFPEIPTELGSREERETRIGLNAVALRACTNDPHKRYASAGEMRRDLERLRGGDAVAPVARGRRRLLAALVLLTAIAGAFFVARRVEPQAVVEKPSPPVATPAAAPVPARLEIATTPPNADFELENAVHEVRGGRTPVRLADLPAGEYTLRLRRLGWPVHTREVRLESGRTTRLEWAFRPQDRIQFPEPGIRWENSLGMKFVPVPGADVLFCVWETRLRDFAAFVDATGYDATGWMSTLKGGVLGVHGATWRHPGFDQSPDHPVSGVSWKDAMAFCRWLTEKERRAGLLGPRQSYLLPSDAEWSRAVGLPREAGPTPRERSGRAGGFPWGSGWPPPRGAGNYAGEEMRKVDWPSNWRVISGYRDKFGRTSPVASFAANRAGLFDLGGNVWEWCLDKYAESGDERLVRGGSWMNVDADLLRSSVRVAAEPDVRNDAYGFRIVVETYASGSASLTSVPEGATVIRDGRELGVTPLELPDLPAGDTVFTVRLDGYRSATIPATIAPGKRADLAVTLTPSPGPVRGRPWTNSLGMQFVPVGDVLMCVWETRVRDFAAFCEESGYQPPPASGFDETPEHPVVRVNWADCEAFCRWLTQREKAGELLQNRETYRLPADLEWSLAVGLEGESGATPEERDSRVRGVFPWGTEWPPPATAGNYGERVAAGRSDGFSNTAAVGSFAPNPLGLHDMGGNAWEWVLEPYRSAGGGRDWGVLRGASWANDSRPTLMSSYRNVVSPTERDVLYGFRVVLEFGD